MPDYYANLSLITEQDFLDLESETTALFGSGSADDNDGGNDVFEEGSGVEPEMLEEGDQPPVLHWCRFDDSYSNRGFYIAFFVSGYAIPLLLIVKMYIFMLKRLWHPVGHQISQVL